MYLDSVSSMTLSESNDKVLKKVVVKSSACLKSVLRNINQALPIVLHSSQTYEDTDELRAPSFSLF